MDGEDWISGLPCFAYSVSTSANPPPLNCPPRRGADWWVGGGLGGTLRIFAVLLLRSLRTTAANLRCTMYGVG